ncbi:MAG: hypothetical protein E7256_11240 [Lachnospiraceae bacterium]|nr:hypothetical protein [Lachnospiraceae bacterium]
MSLEKILEKYYEIINQEKAECEREVEFLINDDRMDEANIAKIRLNVYDIMKTITKVPYETACKGKEEEQAEILKKEYLRMNERIPGAWKAKLARAKEREEADEILIEETKLEVATHLLEKFLEIIEQG